MKNEYDVIVIGSGCGGAAAAALMSSLGYRTLLVEKSRLIGGRAATYEKKGFKLDHGHVLMRCQKGPHGEVLRIAKCKDLIPKFSICRNWASKTLISDKYIKISPNAWIYALNTVGIRQFLSFGFTPGDLADVFKLVLKTGLMTEKKIRKFDHMDMYSYVTGFTNNPYIHTFYGGLAVVGFGALAKEASAGELIRISQAGYKDLFNMGYPVTGEGISAVPKSFVKAAQRHGTDLRKACAVEKIIVENGRAKGVRISGENILSDVVISNTGVKETVDRLVGQEHFDNVYVKSIRNLKYIPQKLLNLE